MAYFRVSKKTLNFSLFNGISLLNFRSRGRNRFFGMNFRRPSRSTNSIASSSATKKNYNIACFRSFAHYS